MKKAVLCIAHKGPEQLNIMIRQFLADDGQTDVYLHIDKKAEAIKADIMQHPNVFFIENSHSITWGNDSTVRMLVDVFNEIVSKNIQYDYFQICTGQDLLVKPGLNRFLEESGGKIYIDTYKNDNYVKNLLLHPYPKCLCRDNGNGFMFYAGIAYALITRVGLIPKKKLRFDWKKVDFWTSYNWSMMPYEVLCYIVKFLNEKPEFLEMYYGSRVPEDGFLATLIMNSPYRDRVQFLPDGKKASSLTFMKPLHGSHPPILTAEDIEQIDASPCFMARKMDIVKDRKIVEYYEKKVIITEVTQS